MNKIITTTKYLAIIAVISLLVASAATFLWGAINTGTTLWFMVSRPGESADITFLLIQLLDIFLIAMALYIFAVSIYELFIDHLPLPEWMLASNLHDLKTKLSSIIILVLSVKFLEQFINATDPQKILFAGLAVALVSGALIAFSYVGNKN